MGEYDTAKIHCNERLSEEHGIVIYTGIIELRNGETFKYIVSSETSLPLSNDPCVITLYTKCDDGKFRICPMAKFHRLQIEEELALRL